MKQFGAERVHHQLIDKFISLVVAIHDFRLRPLIAIFKEYKVIEELSVADYKEAVYAQQVESALSDKKKYYEQKSEEA